MAATLCICCIGIGCLVVPPNVTDFLTAWRHGEMQVVNLEKPPGFLTEELALGCARGAMGRDGLNAKDWRPMEDGRSMAPDGSRDRYLVRHAGDANAGFVVFCSSNTQEPPRTVRIQLKGGKVCCQVWLDK